MGKAERTRLALVLAMLPSLAAADDMAAAARKEKERREKAAAAKQGQTYSDADLASAGGGGGTINIMAAPSPKPGARGADATARVGAAGSAPPAASIRHVASDRGESYWRDRASSLRQRVAAAQTRVTLADQAMGRFVTGPPTSSNCGGTAADAYRAGGIEGLKKASCKDPVAEWTEQRNRAANELDAAKTALASAQKELDGLEDEARRAGALPGWIR